MVAGFWYGLFCEVAKAFSAARPGVSILESENGAAWLKLAFDSRLKVEVHVNTQKSTEERMEFEVFVNKQKREFLTSPASSNVRDCIVNAVKNLAPEQVGLLTGNPQKEAV